MSSSALAFRSSASVSRKPTSARRLVTTVSASTAAVALFRAVESTMTAATVAAGALLSGRPLAPDKKPSRYTAKMTASVAPKTMIASGGSSDSCFIPSFPVIPCSAMNVHQLA